MYLFAGDNNDHTPPNINPEVDIGEYTKAFLTPELPLPELPVTKNYLFVLCIAPALLVRADLRRGASFFRSSFEVG